MAQSNLDASRRKHHKRITVILFTVIPLVVVVGIIYYNNRDVVIIKPGKQVVSVTVKQIDSVGEDTKHIRASEVVNKSLTDSIIAEPVSDPEKKLCDSLRVSGIEFRPVDRPDVILRLTLMLFFSDNNLRSEILLRREEIRVITRKVIQNLEFGAIRKETVEPQVCFAIRKIFENKNLIDVKIADIQIEKVQKP